MIQLYCCLLVLTDSATVADLVGLTFWKYLETTKDPVALVCTASCSTSAPAIPVHGPLVLSYTCTCT